MNSWKLLSHSPLLAVVRKSLRSPSCTSSVHRTLTRLFVLSKRGNVGTWPTAWIWLMARGTCGRATVFFLFHLFQTASSFNFGMRQGRTLSSTHIQVQAVIFFCSWVMTKGNNLPPLSIYSFSQTWLGRIVPKEGTFSSLFQPSWASS